MTPLDLADRYDKVEVLKILEKQQIKLHERSRHSN